MELLAPPLIRILSCVVHLSMMRYTSLSVMVYLTKVQENTPTICCMIYALKMVCVSSERGMFGKR